MDDNFISNRITQLCKQNNLTPYKLSKHSGVPYTTIHTIISGKGLPSIPTLIQICESLKITLSQFFITDFSQTCLTNNEIKLLKHWNNLNQYKQELVLAYIYGLLNLPIDTEAKDDIQRIEKDSKTTH